MGESEKYFMITNSEKSAATSFAQYMVILTTIILRWYPNAGFPVSGGAVGDPPVFAQSFGARGGYCNLLLVVQ